MHLSRKLGKSLVFRENFRRWDLRIAAVTLVVNGIWEQRTLCETLALSAPIAGHRERTHSNQRTLKLFGER